METNTVSSDQTADFVITITVVNNTVGIVPFIIPDGDTVVVGTTTGENGLGVIFNGEQPITASTQVGSYPEEQIHLLGPRQRCVHRVTFTVGQLVLIDQSIGAGGQIRAFYRNSSVGIIPAGNPQQVYADQGLWVGIIESEAFQIPFSAQ